MKNILIVLTILLVTQSCTKYQRITTIITKDSTIYVHDTTIEFDSIVRTPYYFSGSSVFKTFPKDDSNYATYSINMKGYKVLSIYMWQPLAPGEWSKLPYYYNMYNNAHYLYIGNIITLKSTIQPVNSGQSPLDSVMWLNGGTFAIRVKRTN